MIASSGGNERVYRVILALYPAAFRSRFEDEMIQLFQDKLRDARAAGSTRGVAITWLRMVADVVLTAPAEHLRRNRTVAHSLSSAPTPATRVLGTAGVVAGIVILLAYGIELPAALFPVRLVVFGLCVIAIAIGVHRRQSRQAPTVSLLATAGFVAATTAWLGAILFLPPEHIAGFWLGLVLWGGTATFGLVAAGIGAVSRIGAAAVAGGALLTATGIDRLGLVSNVSPTIFNTLSQVGIVTMSLGWIVLGMDVALRVAGTGAGDVVERAREQGQMAIRYTGAFAASGILYALFQASAVTGIGFGDDLWQAGMAMHGVILAVAMVGLIGVGIALRLTGWTAATWWASTALALLGLVVAHAFWSAALIGIAGVLVVPFRSILPGAAMASGGVLWLYVYVAGARIGNEDGRALTSFETVTALVALALMAVGFAAAGRMLAREQTPTASEAG